MHQQSDAHCVKQASQQAVPIFVKLHGAGNL